MNTINAQTIMNEVLEALAIAPSECKCGDFIKFQTSSRGSHRILNCRKNLQRFADLVRKNAAAFGGGLMREEKTRSAVSYNTKTISLYKQLIEDRDYFAALQLADEKLSPLFFVDRTGKAHIQVAPIPLEADSRLTSVLNEDGTWSVIDQVSMLAMHGDAKNKRSRDAQIENAMQRHSNGTDEAKANMFAKAYETPVDQAAARAQWLADHGIVDDAAIDARIEAQAAQDVAEIVAQAVAVSAIAEAMAPEAQELVTCESENEAQGVGISKFINVAADSVNTLRKIDVARVIDETPIKFRGELADYIRLNRADLGKEVHEVMEEYATPTVPPSGGNAVDATTPAETEDEVDATAPAVETAPNTSPAEIPDCTRDIPLSLAVNAYHGVSMSPERRGANAQAEYAQSMAEDYKTMRIQAARGGTLDLLPDVFARYRGRQAAAYRAYLASSSRCISSFIAGPSNFPVARANKRNDIAHKRLNDYLDGGKMAMQSAIRELRPDLRAIMAGDADAIDRLTVKIESAERSQERMKEANKAIRTNAKAGQAHQVEALMALGFSESQSIELIKPDFCGRIGFANYQLTNNNANIRRMRERLESISKAQAQEVKAVECANGVTLEDDAPANRVRLFFPGKPDATIRADLKSNGFRWAPSIGAWQAYRNHHTLTTAKRLAGEPAPAEDAPEVPEVAPIEAMAPVVESTDDATPSAETVPVVEIKDTTPAAEIQPEPMATVVETEGAPYRTLKEIGDQWDADMKAARLEIEAMKAEREASRIEREAQQVTQAETATGWGPAIGERYIGAIERAVLDANRRNDGMEYRVGENAIMERRIKPVTVKNGPACPSVVETEAPQAAKEPAPIPDDQAKFNIRAKNGTWFACVYMVGAMYGLRFEAICGPQGCTTYATHAERMQALEVMAKYFALPTPTPTPPDGGQPIATDDAPTQAHTTPVAVCTPGATVAVSRASDAPLHPRNIIPTNGLHIVDDAFEAWTYQNQYPSGTRFGFVMYIGKSAKPWKYYGYHTEAKRDEGFERHAAEAREIAAVKADDKAKAEQGHGLQVGDVVRSSWGYDQTNVNHYQVIKLIGKRTVEVRELAWIIDRERDMSGDVAPVWGEFIGEPMRRTVDKYGQVNILREKYGRASKIELVAVVHGVRCYAATGYSSYA